MLVENQNKIVCNINFVDIFFKISPAHGLNTNLRDSAVYLFDVVVVFSFVMKG